MSNNSVRKDGIKKGLIVSLIGAIVVMSVLFASLLQATPTVPNANTPSAWIGTPDRQVLAWNFTLTNGTGPAEMNLKSVNLTFTSYSTGSDIFSITESISSDLEYITPYNARCGVCLYNDTDVANGSGVFDPGDTLLGTTSTLYSPGGGRYDVNITGITLVDIGTTATNILVVLNVSANVSSTEVFNISLNNIGYNYTNNPTVSYAYPTNRSSNIGIDIISPTVTAQSTKYPTGTGPGYYAKNGDTITLNATAIDPSPASGLSYVKVNATYLNATAGWVNMTNIAGSNYWTANVELLGAVNGTHTNITVNATDNASNSNTSIKLTVSVDATKPGDLTSVNVNNQTTIWNISAWTKSPVFFVNWSGGADPTVGGVTSGLQCYYYKFGVYPSSYNDIGSTGGIVSSSIYNVTVNLSAKGISDGNVTMWIWAIDNAHNMGNVSSVYLRWDITPPKLNSIAVKDTDTSSPQCYNWTNSLDVKLEIGVTDAGGAGMSGDARVYFNTDGGTPMEKTYSEEALDYNMTYTGITDGTRKIYMTAKDAAGNENTTAINDTIILDMTAPTIPSNGTTYNNTYGFATISDNVTLWAVINDPTSGILLNATGVPYVMLNVTLLNSTLGWVQMTNTTGGNNFTYAMNISSSTTDGDKWLQINATDNATNRNLTTGTNGILCRVDTSKPVVTANPIVYGNFTDALGCTVNCTNATNGNTVTLNVTVYDAGTLKYIMVNVTNITTDSYSGVWVNPPRLSGRWLNLTWSAYKTNTSESYYTKTVTIGNATNGTHLLAVNATDYLNNSIDVWPNDQAGGSVNITLYVDNLIPNVTAPSVNYNITAGNHPFYRPWAGNGDNITLNITVQDNITGNSGVAKVQVYVYDLNNSLTWVNMTNTTGGSLYNYTCSVILNNASASFNGTYILQVKAWDNASKLNDTQYIYVTVNNPPAVTALNTTYINATYTWVTVACNGTLVNISVTVVDPDIAYVNVSLNDTSTYQHNLTYLGGAVWANLTRITGTNTWYNNTINVSAERDGYFNLTINATDCAGNWNNTQNVTVYVDNVKPSVPGAGVVYVTAYGSNGWANNGTIITINVTITDDYAGIHNVTVNASAINSTYSWWEILTNTTWSGANNYTVNLTVSVNTGNYTIRFKVYDTASNLNDTVTVTVYVDNELPQVTLSGYYNVTLATSLLCTNMTNLTSGGWGKPNYSVRNNDTVMLFAHVNDTGVGTNISGILYNATGGYWYIMVYVNLINASQYWIEMKNQSGSQWNFTVNVTIGNTIADNNYTLQLNITDNATNSNTTTKWPYWPCNITVWVKGVAPNITTIAWYPQESPTTDNASRPGNRVTINITVDDSLGCNVSWTNGVWVNVTWINSTGLIWRNATCITEAFGADKFQLNVTVGDIVSGTYNLTVYAIDPAGRTSNDTNVSKNYVLVKVDRDPPQLTSPATEYQNGTSANATRGEWVNMSVTIVDTPAGVYNVTVYVGDVNLTSTWISMTRIGTTNVYWANITVNGGADGTHDLYVRAQDSVGWWNNATYFSVLIRTVGIEVTVTVTLSSGYLSSLGTASTGIIGNNVSIKATTTPDVENVSVDLSAFVNETGYFMSYTNMSDVGGGVWYYNFTIYASPNNTEVNNRTGGCEFNVTAYRAGYKGINNTTAKIDAVRPTSIINQTMPQFWNHTLYNTYLGNIFLNWTHSEGTQSVTFKIFYRVGSTGTWAEWALVNTSAINTTYYPITEPLTYYFYVNATDWAGNSEANYYNGNGIIVDAINLTTGDVSTTVDPSDPASLSIVINLNGTGVGDLFNNSATATVNLTISGYDLTSGLGAIALSNDGLTWQSWYDFVSSVTNITANQQYPAIYGDVIVWYNAGDSDLYAYNLVNKTQWKIFQGTASAYRPGIYGNYIVYSDNDIYAYNIATGATTAICTATGSQLYPAIYGTIVVWEGSDFNIYKYDISNPGAGITQLTTSYKAYTPAIYGNYVVWNDTRNSGTTGSDIYMYNLATNVSTTVCTALGNQQYPVIYGNYIVWEDQRSGTSDIYMYNIGTGETAVCTNSAIQSQPGIYGDYIVWNDTRYDSIGDIFMYTISTGKETRVTADTTAQGNPAVYGSYIVWQDNRGSLYTPITDYDIYMQQIGNTKTMSYLNWGLNGTEGTITVYVSIRDWANNSVTTTDTIIYDITAPTGLTIVINDGNITATNRTVRLNLTAYDPIPAPATNWDGAISNITLGYNLISFRNKTGAGWGAWSAWMLWNGNGTYNYTLSSGDGDRVVEFRIKDRAGNIATAVSDSIMLNTAAPTITFTIIDSITGYDADGNKWYNGTSVRVNISATDGDNITTVYGGLWYNITFDNNTYTGWKNVSTYSAYNWINVSWVSGGATVYDANLTFTKEGVHKIDYNATNRAGTTASGTYYIRIDRTKSNITLSPNATVGNMNCFSTTLNITLALTNTPSQDPNATQSGVNWTKFRVWKEGAVGAFTCGYYNATGEWQTLVALGATNEWVNYSSTYPGGGGLTNLTPYIRLLAEGNYSIEVNTTDYAGNFNTTNVTYLNLTYIRIDMTNPVVSFPANGIQGGWAAYTYSVYINNTWVVLLPAAYDPGDGSTITNASSGLWRYQVSNDNVTWYGYNATNVWTLSVPGNEYYVNWTGGNNATVTIYNWNLTNESVLGNYNKTVYFKIYDNASNYAITSTWIILDTFKPTSTITVSPNNLTYPDTVTTVIINTTVFNITCSCSDVNNSLNGSGIYQYTVWYNYSDDGVNVTNLPFTVTGTGGTSQIDGVDGRVYYFRCNATDWVRWKGDNSSFVKVIIDTTAPTSSADAIATYWHNAPLTINTSTATDPSTGTASGVYSVDLLYKYSLDNSTSWSDWTLFGTDTAASPWSWDFTFPRGDGYYKFCTRAKDKGYNVETALPADYDTIAGYDTAVNSPTVSSTTHTSETTWYSNNDPSVSWVKPTDLSGVIGYYYSLDQIAGTVPTAITGTWTTGTTASSTDKADGIWYFHIVSKDNAGNIGTVATHFTVRIDTAPPTSSDNAPTKWQHTGVTVTLISVDTHSGVAATYYQVGSTTGTWVLGTSASIPAPADHSNDGIHTIYYYSVDKAVTENSEYTGMNYKNCTVKIDTKMPKTTAIGVPTVWKNTNVVFTLSATDGIGDVSGINATYYQVDGGDVTLYVDGITIPAPSDHSNDGEHTIYFYSVDNAGNIETPINTVKVKIDTTEPTISLTKAPTSPDGENNWYMQDVVVTIAATDALSGATGCTIEYNLDSEGWTPYTAQVTISGAGTHTIGYRATDPAGNTKNGTAVTVKIDKTAPTGLSIVINAGAVYTTSSTVSLTISASDATSTVWKMAISNAVGGTWIDYATSFTGWGLTAGDGTKYVYLTVKDYAGNEATAYASIILDTTVPTGSISIAAGATYTTTTTVTLTLSASDANVVTHMCFSNDGTAYTDYGVYAITKEWALATGDGMKTVYVKYKDSAGKEAVFSDMIILDTTAPTGSISIAAGATYTTTTTVTLTLSASDTNGVTHMCFSNDGTIYSSYEAYAEGKSWILTTDGTKTVYVKYKDSAGKEAVFSDTIILDTTVPTGLSISIAAAEYTKVTAVTLTLTATDATQMLVSNDQITWVEYNASWTLSTGDGIKTVYLKALDAAGNVAGPKTDTITLDTTAPTVTIGGDRTVKYSEKKVTFTATVLEDVTYLWTIGTETKTDPSWTYDFPSAGTYTVTLTVTDKAGNTNTASATVTVKEKPAPPFIPAFDMISLFAAFGIALTVLALMKKRKH